MRKQNQIKEIIKIGAVSEKKASLMRQIDFKSLEIKIKFEHGYFVAVNKWASSKYWRIVITNSTKPRAERHAKFTSEVSP